MGSMSDMIHRVRIFALQAEVPDALAEQAYRAVLARLLGHWQWARRRPVALWACAFGSSAQCVARLALVGPAAPSVGPLLCTTCAGVEGRRLLSDGCRGAPMGAHSGQGCPIRKRARRLTGAPTDAPSHAQRETRCRPKLAQRPDVH